jgi:sarcosine oxidase subunit alpha
MFRRLPEAHPLDVRLIVDGVTHRARAGDTVAAALLAAGVERFRITPVRGAPRAPLCMMGVCFDCLVTIDGEGNRQACLVEVRDGMRVSTGHGARDLGETES